MESQNVQNAVSVKGTAIASNSTASPIALPAQTGGQLRMSLLIRATGSEDIEWFYNDPDANAGSGLTIEAGDYVAFDDSLAFPKSISIRSKSTSETTFEINYLVLDNV